MPSTPRWTAAGTLLLPLDGAAWPPLPPLRLDGIDFAPKRELHATIVGTALGARVRAALAVAPALRARIDALCAGLDWRWARGHAWWLLRDDAARPCRASVVEELALPAMARFHAGLGGLLGAALPVPPPHVTLYTAGDARGIGVPDAAAWQRLATRALDAGELGFDGRVP